jgi:hypothetical protein
MNETMNELLTNPDLTSNLIPHSVQNGIAGEIGIEGDGAGDVVLVRAECKTKTMPTIPTPSHFSFNGSAFPSSSIKGPEIKTSPRPILTPATHIAVNRQTPVNEIQSTQLRDSQTVSLTSSASSNIDGPDQVHDFSKLNRSDLTELFQHHDLLSLNQTKLLETVRRKQQLYPQRYRDDYLRHSSILLLSNGWSSALRYSMCSVPNPVNRSGQCKLHKYCPYCCFLERQRALAKYVPAYDSGVWHFLTGSFTGDLTMTGTNSYYDLQHYWDAYKLTLQQLVKDKLVRGVFWTEELAVNSIAPVHVLPHIHALIEADALDDETVELLKAGVVRNLEAALGPDCLTPNIKVKNLNSRRKLLSHVQYQLKPIQIVKAYDLAWSRSVHNNRAGAVQLNSQTTDLVLGYSTATKDRNKINYAGNLSPKTKLYIGTREKEMKEARKLVGAVMKEGADYIELEEPKVSPIEDITTTE